MKKKIYWTIDTDIAVINFINEMNIDKRNKIYEKNIHTPFTTMIESLINKLNVKKFKDYERDLETLRSICYIKFFELFDINNEKSKERINIDQGRPFNYLTTVVRNEILQYVYKSYKKRTQIETNFLDNEEFAYNESEDNWQTKAKYNSSFIDSSISEMDTIDDWEVYNLIIKLLKRDLNKDIYKSEKEKLFAEQLLYLMENINTELRYNSKFFIKMLLAELTGFKRTSINYYLGKVYNKYMSEIKELYETN